jgi:hypothetical protein
MQRLMQMIKKYWVYGLFFCSVIIFLVTKVIKKTNRKEKETFQLSVISVDSGFGYEILKNKQPFIRQTQIPAIQGSKVFKTEKDAKKIGELMVLKMKQNQIPNITELELVKKNSYFKLYNCCNQWLIA